MIWCNLLVTSGEVRNVRAPTIRKEMELLKLPPYWEIVHIDNEEIVIKCFDNLTLYRGITYTRDIWTFKMDVYR